MIIESFAGLRGDSDLGSSKKDKKKPVIVLEHSDDNLRLQYLKNHESTTAFEKKLHKYYVNLIEKLFLILVLVDAIVTATKHTGMSDTWLLILRLWQVKHLQIHTFQYHLYSLVCVTMESTDTESTFI